MFIFPGIGVLANVAGIIAGGITGTIFGDRIAERFKDTLLKTCALVTIFLGIGGTLKEMLVIDANGQLACARSEMMLVSLLVGAFIGECIDLEDRLESFGRYLRQKTGSNGDSRFIEGFVTASLTVCIGAMAVIGSIEDRLMADPSILFAKTALDCIIVFIMSATYGRGCIFSALSVGVFQGTIFLAAGLLAPVMTPQALSDLSYVGNILIFCVGVNILGITHIRVANLLPALVLATAWSWM